MSGWIKCSERLPVNLQDCFVFIESVKSVTVGYFSEANKNFMCGIGSLEVRKISHWSPCHLPKPPEPEESELVKKVRSELFISKSKCDEFGLDNKKHDQWNAAILAALGVIQNYEREKGGK